MVFNGCRVYASSWCDYGTTSWHFINHIEVVLFSNLSEDREVPKDKKEKTQGGGWVQPCTWDTPSD
jgi:hypothetical protein